MKEDTAGSGETHDFVCGGGAGTHTGQSPPGGTAECRPDSVQGRELPLRAEAPQPTADVQSEPEANLASPAETPQSDLVAQLLDAARREAAARGLRMRRRGRRPGRRTAGWSGPGPDDRDPQPLGDAARGWSATPDVHRELTSARIFTEWPSVVGAELAQHCRPHTLEAGRLIIEAESTAWATQLRLLSSVLAARLHQEVGGLVTSIEVRGPTAPSWSRGPRRVRGRGPRDTYG